MIRTTVKALSVIGAMGFLTSCTEMVGMSGTVAPTAEVARAMGPAYATRALARTNTEVELRAYMTAYSYWDNTPPGSAAISKPVLRNRAGGTGTYADPITIAVGHRIERGVQTLDYPAGTRFYIEQLRKYAIVEDVCGDGNQPQYGPCHSGHNGLPWVDIWIGGARADVATVNSCAYRITGVQRIVMNPARGYPVDPGEIVASGCRSY